MQFFIKGRRTDGRFYREIEAALHALAECRFTFVDSSDGMRHTTNTGVINDPETLSPLEGADGRNSIVSFSMTRSMLETIFDASYGFHKFIEADCMALRRSMPSVSMRSSAIRTQVQSTAWRQDTSRRCSV